MEYVKKVILPDETLLISTRRHVFVLIGDLIKETIILIIVGIGLIAVQWSEIASPVRSYLFAGIALVALIVFISIFLDWLQWRCEQFILTSRRVIHCKGVLNKSILDSSLDKINDVILRQSWLGRIFGFGTIEILTASDQAINQLERISKPIDFKRAMLQAKAGLESPHMPPAPAQRSAADLLQDLAQMKERGLISESEYESKKIELLKRM